MDKIQKEYLINGIGYKLNPCSAVRFKTFSTEFDAAKGSPEKYAELARTCVTPKYELEKRTPEFPEPDFVTEVDGDIIMEIIEDFFLKWNPTFGNAMRYLRTSKNPKTVIPVSDKKNGQSDGSGNEPVSNP